MYTKLEYLFDHIVRIYFRAGQTWQFSGLDSEKLFQENSKRQDWEWQDVDIDYCYNSWGYRTPEFKLDQDYGLAFGCSHTEGTGLALAQTYPCLLEQELGYPVFNLGLAGSSNQMIYFNNVQWIKNYKKLGPNARLPKIVYVQWTQVSRRGEITEENVYATCGPNFNYNAPIWCKMVEQNLQNFMMETWYYYHSVKLLWQALGVEQIHFSVEPQYVNTDFPRIISDCDWHWVNQVDLLDDYARDQAHMGPKSQQKLVSRLEDIRRGRDSWVGRSDVWIRRSE
jgi:hypothetical protein